MTDFLNWFLSCLHGLVVLLFSMQIVSGVTVGAILVIGFAFALAFKLIFTVVRKI